MIKLGKAIRIILCSSLSLKSETVKLIESCGRVLAQDLFARSDMPPFEKSAMDGFALRSRNTKFAPVELKVIENLPAGKIARRALRKGECAKIMTGSALPCGADSVVMVEDTRPAGRDKILVAKKVSPQENVCLRGEDFHKGKLLIKKGKTMGMAEVAVFASPGKTKDRKSVV